MIHHGLNNQPQEIHMSDEITIKLKSESTPVTTQQNQAASSNRTQLVNLCALGLGISFFLPWAQILVATPSGFDLQKWATNNSYSGSSPYFA
jgi:hypothetical protein